MPWRVLCGNLDTASSEITLRAILCSCTATMFERRMISCVSFFVTDRIVGMRFDQCHAASSALCVSVAGREEGRELYLPRTMSYLCIAV